MREKFIKKCDLFLILCLFITIWTLGNAFDAKSFDDTILFKLNWPGKDSFEALASEAEAEAFETLLVTTQNNEKYKCLLPQNLEKEKEQIEAYTGPTAVELLSPLFSQSSCSYRLESYWTYELCHGRYIRQYHEERDGKKHKLQEYFLGKWDKKLINDLKEELINQEKNSPSHLPVKKIDGLSLPYFQINMTDGTLCDLNGKHRMTRVQYVCYIHGKHEIYSLKEASTCEYEAVVLSPFLCQHPDYRAQETGEHPISCLPVDGAPKKPKALLSMEAESLKLRHQRGSDDKKVNAEYFWQDEKQQKMYAVFSIDRDGDAQDGEARVRVEIHPIDMLTDVDTANADLPALNTDPSGPQPPPAFPKITAINPVKNFLSGKNCLTGGSGWWKYEYCYGRTVSQYHEEKDGTRTSIELGKFNLEKHREWLEQNPHKKPKPLAQRKQVSHFYSDGSYCEKADKPRQVEVKLKCLEDSSPGAVSLYLLEPRVCEYLLGVESPAICDLLALADSDGILPNMEQLQEAEGIIAEVFLTTTVKTETAETLSPKKEKETSSERKDTPVKVEEKTEDTDKSKEDVLTRDEL